MFRINVIQLLILLFLTGCIVNNASPAIEPLPVTTFDIATVEMPTAEITALEIQREIPTAIPPIFSSPVVTEAAIGAVTVEMPTLETAAVENQKEIPTTTPPLLLSPVVTKTANPASTPTEPPLQVTINVEEEVSRILSDMLPPVRDDLRLARAYRGIERNEENIVTRAENSPTVGAQQIFRIVNVVDNTVGEIQAELLAASDHAYFWFDIGPGSSIPDQDTLESVAMTFDDIYENVVAHFGSENNPGIDGDPRLHVVNASPIALCGVTEETADQCYLAGLVQQVDLLPSTVDPRSNEREMFVMNGYRFGSDYYLGVLAHEFRHMIEDNYDRSDTDWEKEGSATLAAQLAGFPSGGVERGNMFLEKPDQQLNSWTEDNTAPYYGQGYILNRYIYDRLGKEIYLQFATNPLPGLHAVDSVAEEHNLSLDGESLWLDWLVSLAVHDDPRASEQYRFESQGLNRAAMTSITSIPADYSESVRQYAADYYEIPDEAGLLTFSGATEVPLLGTDPISGERFWFAQRGNNSNPRLTRWVDLTKVDDATLSYHIYTDIEQGYDFAYVSVSVDGGLTWIPLVAPNMQGLDPADNPAGSAFADRFYTGRTRQWIEEEIDLSSFAGRSILLRFEYITDPILTYGGFAIDDIIIPEIGFFDDVESEDPSWLAEGFVRATASLPQNWHLQLITFEEENLSVQQLVTNQDGELSISLESLDSTQLPILVVAASAPTTLEPADYELKFHR